MDRRPLIGTHPDYNNVHLLNGFGTRGVLGAPLLSKWLFDHIEGECELPRTNINIIVKFFAHKSITGNSKKLF